MINILITGVGGPLGQGIIKACRKSKIPCHLIGTDRAPLSVGLDWVDESAIIPDCSDSEKYIAALITVCQKLNVQLILPGSEGEIRVISENKEHIEKSTCAKLVAPPLPILEVCFDKLRTCYFLDKQGLNFPAYASLKNHEKTSQLVAEQGYPLLAKPCRGSGSQGIFIIHSNTDLQYVRSLNKEYVLQELLQPDDQEYTVGIYTTIAGEQISGICMRRELAAGNTYRAWVIPEKTVLKQARSVVQQLGIIGPCNVQLRLTDRGAIPFEINPRFSGTTGMRAHFGYNEVEMVVRDFVLNESIPHPTIQLGTALRFWEEHYLASDE